MRRKKLERLTDWIDNYGKIELAETLGLDKTTIYLWASGKAIPKVKHLLVLKRLSRGALTCDSMIEDHFKNLRAAQK